MPVLQGTRGLNRERCIVLSIVRNSLIQNCKRVRSLVVESVGGRRDELSLIVGSRPVALHVLCQRDRMFSRIKLVAGRCLRLLQGKCLRRLILAKSAGKNLAADDVPCLITPYYRPAVVQSELRTGKILIVYLVLLLNPDRSIVRGSARDSLIQDRKRVRSLVVEFVGGRRDELPVVAGSRPTACNTLRQRDRMLRRIKLVACRGLRLLQGEGLRRFILAKSAGKNLAADDVPGLISPYYRPAIVQSELCTGKILVVYLVFLLNPDRSVVRSSARDSLIQDGKRVRSLVVESVGGRRDKLSLIVGSRPVALHVLCQRDRMFSRIKLVAGRCLRLLQGEGLRRFILAKSAGKNLAADDVPGLISPYYRPAIVQSELCTGKILVVYLVFLLNPDRSVVRSSARDSLIQDGKRVRSLAVELVGCRRDELPLIAGPRPVTRHVLGQRDRMLRRIKLIACRCLCLLQGKLLLFGISKAEDQVFAADDVPGLITPYYSLAVVQSELRIGKILIVYLVLLLNPDRSIVRGSARDSLIQDRKRVRSLVIELVGGRRDELPVITGSRPVACNTLRQRDRMFCRIKLVAGRSLRLLQCEGLRRLILSKSDSQCFTADDVPCLISPYFSLAIVQSKLCTGKILFVYLVLLFNPDLSIVRKRNNESTFS